MKKSKIFLIITNLVLCLCAIFVGVWAIGKPSAKVNSNGTVTFSGRGINASVSGKIYGYAQSGDLNQVVAEQNGITLETLVFNPSASDASGTDSDKSSWTTSRDLKFSYNGDPITIKFTITNNLNVAPIYAKIIDQTVSSKLNFSIVYEDSTTSTLDNIITINNNETKTIKVLMSPKNLIEEFVFNYDLFIKLSYTQNIT